MKKEIEKEEQREVKIKFYAYCLEMFNLIKASKIKYLKIDKYYITSSRLFSIKDDNISEELAAKRNCNRVSSVISKNIQQEFINLYETELKDKIINEINQRKTIVSDKFDDITFEIFDLVEKNNIEFLKLEEIAIISYNGCIRVYEIQNDCSEKIILWKRKNGRIDNFMKMDEKVEFIKLYDEKYREKIINKINSIRNVVDNKFNTMCFEIVNMFEQNNMYSIRFDEYSFKVKKHRIIIGKYADDRLLKIIVFQGTAGDIRFHITQEELIYLVEKYENEYKQLMLNKIEKAKTKTKK